MSFFFWTPNNRLDIVLIPDECVCRVSQACAQTLFLTLSKMIRSTSDKSLHVPVFYAEVETSSINMIKRRRRSSMTDLTTTTTLTTTMMRTTKTAVAVGSMEIVTGMATKTKKETTSAC